MHGFLLTEVNIGDIVHFSLPKYAPATDNDKKDQDVKLKCLMVLLKQD